MSNASALIRFAFGLALALALAAGAGAQTSNGVMGPQSRATIRISVSVMPRFSVAEGRNAAGIASDQSGPMQPLNVSSNAPGLRFSLVAASEAQRDSAGQSADGARLLLVVPD
jgi:hypothetical protein